VAGAAGVGKKVGSEPPRHRSRDMSFLPIR
jgi:hypothetical protein